MNPTLRKLLDQGEQYDPYYLPSMNTDHMPMSLVAMDALGSSSEQLVSYQKNYLKRLRPVQSGPELSSISEGRGKFNAFEELRRLLKDEISARGSDAVIQDHLPELLPSLAAGAFHPLIRLGFAVTAKHDVEVATALAYWMTSSLNPPQVVNHDAKDLAQSIHQLEPVEKLSGRFGEGLSWLVEQGCYPNAIDTSFEDCARTSLSIYQGTRNFFALHFVTATQAARVCAPFVSRQALISALTAATQAGYLVVGAPDFSDPLPVPAQLDEEHNIKYMYACAEEYKHYGDKRYLEEMHGFVAAGLVPSWIQIPN